MRAIRLDKGSPHLGEKCQAGCGRSLKVGQVVVKHRMGSLTWDKEMMLAHARCLRRILDDAPAERDPAELEAFKERVRAGGPLFPQEAFA